MEACKGVAQLQLLVAENKLTQNVQFFRANVSVLSLALIKNYSLIKIVAGTALSFGAIA